MTITGGQIAEVQLIGDFDGTENVEGVYQFEKVNAGSISTADFIDDMIELFDTIGALIAPILSILTVLRTVRVANRTTGAVYGVHPLTAPIPGNGTGDSAPPGVATLAWFPTDVSRVIGRKFWGSVPESVVGANGTFVSGHMTNVGTLIAALVTDIPVTNGTYHYGYLSPKVGSFKRFNTAVSTNIPAYQRRRRQGRGA